MLQWFHRRRIAVTGSLLGAAIAAGALLPTETRMVIWASSSETCEAQEERVRRAASSPFGEDARALAREALNPRAKPKGDHAFVKYKAELRSRLERLGLLVASPDHVHISDVDLVHGGAVLRAGLGFHPLVTTVSSTLSVSDVPEEFARRSLRPEQYVRLAPIFLERAAGDHVRSAPEDLDQTSFADLMETALVGLEYSILEKKMRLEQLRLQRKDIPPSARIFVNMSFGTSPERASMEIAATMLRAPPGSPLHDLARRVLGEALVKPPDGFDDRPDSPCGGRSRLRPRLPRQAPGEAMPPEVARFLGQAARLKRDLIYRELRTLLATKEVRRILDTARTDLQAEMNRSRAAGILVFEAAGNEYADALAAGDPKMSESTTGRIRGNLLVGAIDPRDLRDSNDDRVAPFSAAGKIAFSTIGVGLPVWIERGIVTDQVGTSFSSPIALEIAAATGTALPRARIDRIERILKDPRVALDIRGTTRDGAGVLDPFAAVLLAANPKLTPAEIQRAWRALGDPNADAAAIRRSLGIAPSAPPLAASP